MVEKFETGKKYKLHAKPYSYDPVFTCYGAAPDGNGLMKNDNNETASFTATNPNLWHEYTPPPPEQWAALLWNDENRRHYSVSGYTYPTKQKVISRYTTCNDFIRAIRVDDGDNERSCS